VRDLLSSAIGTGRIPRQPVEVTALTMLGAMREATLYIAHAQQHDRARQDAGAVMNRLIDALAAQ
jgi:Tetracyclin repressor-like, C-terminal domain